MNTPSMTAKIINPRSCVLSDAAATIFGGNILSTTSDTHCPALSHPYIMYYGDALYIFGGQLESFYKSATGGIAWEKPEEKFLFPAEFALKGTSYTATVDQNNYIWIVARKIIKYMKQHLVSRFNAPDFRPDAFHNPDRAFRFVIFC